MRVWQGSWTRLLEVMKGTVFEGSFVEGAFFESAVFESTFVQG